MIYVNFRYFIHELCNLKENYAFTEEKCEITNFSVDFPQIMVRRRLLLICGTGDLHIIVIVRDNL